jgi:aryl-alcohol dehydrogenase-like predicted oxidoreductase
MSELREMGRSGLKAPPLMLGSNVFGWTVDKSTTFAILDAFVDGGGVAIDTADIYSNWVPGHVGGEAETLIGEWLRVTGKRNHVLIATKVGMMDSPAGRGLQPEHITAAADASLRRLGVERIDLYFAHQDDPSVPIVDVLGAFDTLIRQGKVGAIGASNFAVARVEEALATSEAHGLARYEVVQPPYNLLERSRFEEQLQAVCLREGLGVVSYSGLAMGFLTGKYRKASDLSKGLRNDVRAIKPLEGKGRAVLAAMDTIADETGAALATIALAWVAAQPGITAPIASATNLAQLRDLMRTLTFRLSADQLERLDRVIR